MTNRNIFTLAFFTLAFSLLSSCTKDNCLSSTVASTDQADDRAQSVVYPLNEANGSGVSGTVTFQKAGSKTKVIIELVGTTAGASHPVYLRFNSVEAITEDIIGTLEPVNGKTGRSTTMFTHLDDFSPITYEEMVNFDGHITVELSAEQPDFHIAEGNIGLNAQ
jgi:hypothetical protein